jgi:hypothetical protein
MSPSRRAEGSFVILPIDDLRPRNAPSSASLAKLVSAATGWRASTEQVKGVTSIMEPRTSRLEAFGT